MNETTNSTAIFVDEDVFTGVPSEYDDLWAVVVFGILLYVVGDVVCQRGFRLVPALVGHIAVGVALGPEGLHWVPLEESWVLLGNLGLVLLLTQAGLEMDLPVLRQIGVRGFVMAVTGSILPIALGMLWTMALGYTGKTVIAAGCCFGPTSAGIAMNVLGSALLEQPVGQLIVAAAIVDDILALLVLSQLQVLTAESSSDIQIGTDVVLPIASAFLWLFLGGALALFVAPKILSALYETLSQRVPGISKLISLFRLDSQQCDPHQDRVTFSFTLLVGMLVGLLSATFHSEASYLLGAFLTGLTFCQEPGVAPRFRQHLQLLVDWLMKFFFAATIGFQVPVQSWNASSLTNGLVLSLSLLGKLAVGPLFTPRQWNTSTEESQPTSPSSHWRDCAIVGWSMAGEAEFAFVVAVYGVTEGLLPPELYSSIVLAILLSTIVSPVCLRIVLSSRDDSPSTCRNECYRETEHADDIDSHDKQEDQTSRRTQHRGH